MTYSRKHTCLAVCLFSAILFIAGCSSSKNIKRTISQQQQDEIERAKLKANLTPQSPRETIIYEPEYPELYTVKEGDTLWDISTKFLENPWMWPEIWYKNPQIDNPHLIYPGDQLAIIYIGGEKRVQLVKRGESYAKGLKVVKISPRIHTQSIDSSIPSIPIESIRQLLLKPLVMDEAELADAPYILASKHHHLANSTDDVIYVRGIGNNNQRGRFNIFRPNRPLTDIVTGEEIGYEALYLGEAKILQNGDPASLVITSSTREILRDDRLLPINHTDIERDFFPKPPEDHVNGQVLSLLDGISQVGQYSTIAINLGQRDNIQVGHLLKVNRSGKIIRDFVEEDPEFRVQLPDEKSALIMVIKTYEKMSYCLILEAEVPVKTGDIVLKP